MSVLFQKFAGITLRETLFLCVFVLHPGSVLAGRPGCPGKEPLPTHNNPVLSRINLISPWAASKANRGFEDRITDQKQRGVSALHRAARSLSDRYFLGWVVAVGLIAVGVGLLMFGWRAINAAFIPVATIIGLSLGAYMGINLGINPLDNAAIPALVGAAVGGTFLGITAARAEGVAWMLIGIAPFLALAAFSAPANQLVALLSVFAGLVLGLWTSLDARTPLVISTATLGTIMLVFAWCIIAHLLPAGRMASLFLAAAANPTLLAIAMVVCLILGADFQRLTARQNRPINLQDR